MKSFLLQTFGFLFAVAFFVISVVAVVTGVDFRAYRAALKAPDGADVIACNDSQMATGLDPSLSVRLWNKSAIASPCDASYLRLRDSLAANPGQIKFVLIDVSQINVEMDDRVQPLRPGGERGDHVQLQLLNSFEFPRKLGSVGKIFTDLYLRRLDKYRSAWRHGKPLKTPMCGGFSPLEVAGFVQHRDAAVADMKVKARPEAALTPESRCLFWFRKMAECALDSGARPVFVTTPLHPEFRKAMNAKRLASIPEAAAALAREFDAPYFNYLEMTFPENCWKDCNHLNVRGAKAFTRRVLADVESLSARSGVCADAP